ncbi:MAG TPA: quinoprotein dehydrogenase-associated SoxYZ-like carrier [Methylocella sp.]|nr:quinoprotein dehydrogenase-associated SoxYZ-like carrier [Methylocella sp.]
MFCSNRRFFLMAGVAAVLNAGAAMAQEDEAARKARWQDLANEIFGAQPLLDGTAKIVLEAPDRALDAALVPVSIRVQNPQEVKSLYLIIDDNPAPIAAHVSYGPAGDPQSLKLRVRVNDYTYMHAVEETQDGALYETHRFVKASGGCSAPSGAYDEAALAQIGEMKLRLLGEPQTTGPVREAQLLIRHPNFNGMQRDPQTQGYTPARFLKTVDIRLNGETVLHLDSDISLAADPAIGFAFKAQPNGKLAVEAKDSDAQTFKREFALTESRS